MVDEGPLRVQVPQKKFAWWSCTVILFCRGQNTQDPGVKGAHTGFRTTETLGCKGLGQVLLCATLTQQGPWHRTGLSKHPFLCLFYFPSGKKPSLTSMPFNYRESRAQTTWQDVMAEGNPLRWIPGLPNQHCTPVAPLHTPHGWGAES